MFKNKLYLILILFAISNQSLTFQTPELKKNNEKTNNAILSGIVNKYFALKCKKGDAFSCDKTTSSGTFGYSIRQFNGFSWKTEKLLISETESINGMQWKGYIIISCKRYRDHKTCGSFQTSIETKKCGEWNVWYDNDKTAPFKIYVYKEKNKWVEKGVEQAHATSNISCCLSAADCSDVERALKTK